MKLTLITVFCFAFFFVHEILAVENYKTNTSMNCKVTPEVFEYDKPIAIYFGNNLLKKVGSAEFAKGEYIEIEGRVLSSKCEPITQAVVEIWQQDANGYDVNKYLFAIKQNSIQDVNFIGSGSATTDNLGYFRFYTLIPKKSKMIHFSVHHSHHTYLESVMFFPEFKYNRKIKRTQAEIALLTLNKSKTKQFISTLLTKYQFDIVLKGSNEYKKY